MIREHRPRLSVSFREEYRHVYNHLLGQANKSDYICRILDKEIQREQSVETFEEQIGQLLQLLSEGKGIIADKSSLDRMVNEMEQKLDEEDIDLINGLF